MGARNVGKVLQQKMQHDEPVNRGTTINSARRYAATRNQELKFSKGKPQQENTFTMHGVHEWVLQQDGDMSHAQPSNKATAVYSKPYKHSRLSIIPLWPGCSPDLSPIENFWAVMQGHANRVGYHTLDTYRKQQKKAIRGAKVERFDKYYIYMPKRLSQCISNNGERMLYKLYLSARCNVASFANSMSNSKGTTCFPHSTQLCSHGMAAIAMGTCMGLIVSQLHGCNELDVLGC